MTYKYTHTKSVDSSAVEEVFYNAYDKNLYLVMEGGSGYRYKQVPYCEYVNLVDASSVGRYYATNIKNTYGPSEYLGYFNESDDEFELVNEAVQQSFSTTAPSYVVPPTTSTVGMPKALTYSTQSNGLRSKYTVTFECNGKVREHNVEATSLDEAIVFVQSFAEMLELNFKVKSVTLHFA